MKKKIEEFYPYEVCNECGVEANRLTCLKKYKKEPKQKAFLCSTYHKGKCEICKKTKWVTEPRDFFYPDFNLLLKKMNVKKKKETV